MKILIAPKALTVACESLLKGMGKNCGCGLLGDDAASFVSCSTKYWFWDIGTWGVPHSWGCALSVPWLWPSRATTLPFHFQVPLLCWEHSSVLPTHCSCTQLRFCLKGSTSAN